MFSASNTSLLVSPVVYPDSVALKKHYISGYTPESPIKSVENQWKILLEAFPEIPSPNWALFQEMPEQSLPQGAEKYFVLPHWSVFGTSYPEVLYRLIKLFSATRKVVIRNRVATRLNAQFFRESAVKRQFWEEVQEFQSAKTIIVPAQFGALYAGKSVSEAMMISLFLPSSDSVFQVCLGLYEALIMLLTHPERLSAETDLWLLLPGDELAVDVSGMFRASPCVVFQDDTLQIGHMNSEEKLPEYGAISAFMCN